MFANREKGKTMKKEMEEEEEDSKWKKNKMEWSKGTLSIVTVQ
jgi:hypothetical protein